MAEAEHPRAILAIALTSFLLTPVALSSPARADDPAALAVEEIASGIFVHTGVHETFSGQNRGGIANLAFVIGAEAVAVIDTGGSRAQGLDLRTAIEARTRLPIRYVINTHAHPDHVLGNAAFEDLDPVFVGHAKLARALAERGPHYLDRLRDLMGEALDGSTLVMPDLLVEDEIVLDLGGRELELRAWPTAHTDADLTVLDPATATLFAGDLVFMERIPVVDGRLNGWLEVLDALEAIPAERVVPGHGPASAPWPAALLSQRTYLLDLRDGLRAALEQGLPLSRAVEATPPTGDWLLSEEDHPRNVMAGYTELEWE